MTLAFDLSKFLFTVKLQKYIVLWALLLALKQDLKFTIACQHQPEGWLSPTERASVSAISLRHTIWPPHESHADMSFGGAGIWLCQDSLRHILASPMGTPLGQSR